ncbi:hypothetical protein PVA45_08375 (plasmid) [Entomospira entomophila]|uniref:Uncharacterized protein n=1 Tax=Entomospira entomophila TaxID=2719988 RepID=A0A968GBA9_9SPIO|nr:hypothetical protein [Entomospira entomophilus]NIZ41526.1 hypothetical protein [Entomospira entomophilus]WDI36446.1 hypothetical protein PVA45_08375 [Entomospira entomophilus]
MEHHKKPYSITFAISEEERKEFQDFFKKNPYLRLGGLTKYLLRNFIRNNPDGIINPETINE